MLWPSALMTVGSHLLNHWLGADQGFWMLPQSSMAILAISVCLQFWIGLTITGTALDVVRADGRWRPVRRVPAPTAFEAAVVAMALTLATFAALLFLIIPGVWLALRWSQATLLILEGRAAWFAAAEASADLTYGRLLNVLAVWLVIGGLFFVIGLIEAPLTSALSAGAGRSAADAIRVLIDIPASAFSFATIAALFQVLDRT